MRGLAAAFTGAVLLTSSVAPAATLDDLVNAARAFDESALRDQDDSTRQMPVRKWNGPIKVALRNPAKAPSLVEPTLRMIRGVAERANIEMNEVDVNAPGVNFVVVFDDNENATGQNGCQAITTSAPNWTIVKAEIKISPAFRGQIDFCIIHEVMHTFGFSSHPHGADSVLSYVYRRTALTRLDIDLIKTLYEPAMRPGLLPLPASVEACKSLARLMGNSAQDTQQACAPSRRAVRSVNGETFQIAAAAVTRTAGTCVERANYMVSLYPGKLSFSYGGAWHTFLADSSGAFGGSFTVQLKPTPLDVKLSGNLKSRAITVENVTEKCTWVGTVG